MNTGNKIILYRTLINAIQDLKVTADALRETLMKENMYSVTVRGMVRGLHITMQSLAVSLGHDKDKMHGSVAWSYFLLVREFEPEHIDEAIDRALENAKKFYEEAQEETPTEEELCTS